MKASRSIFINIVRWHFPRLIEAAKAKAAQVEHLDESNILMEQLTQAARAVLERFTAS